jgi:small subunit ribosomal protein S21
MIEIKIDGKISIDVALKKYKSKYIRIGIANELKERKTFTKKSVKKRQEIRKAKYVQSIKTKEQE